jgi:hypothetical protein
MEGKGIDVEMSLSILEDYNSGLYDGVKPVKAAGVPAVDGRTVVAIEDSTEYAMDAKEAAAKLAELALPLPAGARREGGNIVFGREALAEIGERLFPRTAYGVLNGGSATSYADRKKNLAFGEEVFSLLEKGFDALAPLCKDRPKGVTPAYMNPDGSLGESFLLLKARARLVAASSYIAKYGPIPGPFLPLFQMSSVGNDAELEEAYSRYAASSLLAPLAARTGLEAASFETGIQPLISAYTHSSEGRPKRIFDRAHGKADSAIALPGGHGQCFRVLAPVFRKLRDSGIRFAYLGNVDNLGYLPDPVEVALLALSGRPAAFDFSKRTSVDVKGGILVETQEGTRTVADIGPAISFDEVKRLEASGASILFNCAIGLFDLDWLVPRLDEIARTLPLRVSDQDKDAGKYSQAEQVTWEVTGILPSFLAFAVDKYDRFIAAKLLAETLLTSGVADSGVADSSVAGGGEARLPQELAETSRRLKEGLFRKLSGPYGLELKDGRWQARL